MNGVRYVHSSVCPAEQLDSEQKNLRENWRWALLTNFVKILTKRITDNSNAHLCTLWTTLASNITIVTVFRVYLTFCRPCISVYLSQYITNSPIGGRLVHETTTYRRDDTRGCVMHFWPPDDEHMCSKHVEAWNKLIVKQKFCASSWLITEMHGQQNFKKINN